MTSIQMVQKSNLTTGCAATLRKFRSLLPPQYTLTLEPQSKTLTLEPQVAGRAATEGPVSNYITELRLNKA